MHESTQQIARKLDPEPVIKIGATMYLIALIAETLTMKIGLLARFNFGFSTGRPRTIFNFISYFSDREATIFYNFYQKSR